MSAADLHKRYVGKHGELSVELLTIPVLITDARTVWNRTDLEVTPRHGSGFQWVSAIRVTKLADPSTVEGAS
jgi:hypothetical protein